MHPYAGRLIDERPDRGAMTPERKERHMDARKAERLMHELTAAILQNQLPNMVDMEALEDAGYKFERRRYDFAGMDGIKFKHPDGTVRYLTIEGGAVADYDGDSVALFAELMKMTDGVNSRAMLNRIGERSKGIIEPALQSRLYAKLAPLWSKYPEPEPEKAPEPEPEREPEEDKTAEEEEDDMSMKQTIDEQGKRIEELMAELERMKAEAAKAAEPEQPKAKRSTKKAAESKADMAEEVSMSALLERMRKWCADRKDVVAIRKNDRLVTPVRIEGATKPYKDELKELGFRYARKGFWYYGPKEAERQGKRVVA